MLTKNTMLRSRMTTGLPMNILMSVETYTGKHWLIGYYQNQDWLSQDGIHWLPVTDVHNTFCDDENWWYQWTTVAGTDYPLIWNGRKTVWYF